MKTYTFYGLNDEKPIQARTFTEAYAKLGEQVGNKVTLYGCMSIVEN